MNSKKKMSDMIVTHSMSRVMSDMINPMTNVVSSYLTNKMIYRVDITNFTYYLKHMRRWFKHLPENINIDMGGEVTSETDMDGFAIRKSEFYSTMVNFIDVTFYRGTPLFIYKTSHNGHEVQRGRAPEIIELCTIRTKTNIENLNKFIRHMVKLYINDLRHDKVRHIYKKSTHYNEFIPIYAPYERTFDDVFIPRKQRELLVSSIEKFINNREWYINNKLPYHFGIMLYGPVGTGKTSVVQALSNIVPGATYYLSGDRISELPKVLSQSATTPLVKEKYNVVVIEDIDCGFIDGRNLVKQYKSDDDDETNKSGFAEILNCIDGISAPQNTIYIFTTNHIDKLDPALIRPGRCDIVVEIGYVTEETFKDFCKFHYNESIDERIDIRDGLTFAELQTEVMRGKSIRELIDYVSIKDEVISDGNT